MNSNNHNKERDFSGKDIERNYTDIERYYNNGKGVVVDGDEPEVTPDGLDFVHPEQYYRAGGHTYDCPECGQTIETECEKTEMGDELHTTDGTTEIAYCDNCDIQYERERKHLFDNIQYSDGLCTTILANRGERIYNTPYDCLYCNQEHYYTKPVSQFKKTNNNTLHSYERIVVQCECGTGFEWEKRKCPECNRQFELQINCLNK